jgi:hypothetical protein
LHDLPLIPHPRRRQSFCRTTISKRRPDHVHTDLTARMTSKVRHSLKDRGAVMSCRAQSRCTKDYTRHLPVSGVIDVSIFVPHTQTAPALQRSHPVMICNWTLVWPLPGTFIYICSESNAIGTLESAPISSLNAPFWFDFPRARHAYLGDPVSGRGSGFVLIRRHRSRSFRRECTSSTKS